MDYIQSETAWGWTSYRCKYQTCDSSRSTLILLWKGAWAGEEERGELWGHPPPSTTPLILQMTAQECGLWDAATAWWNVTRLQVQASPFSNTWTGPKTACKSSYVHCAENNSCYVGCDTWHVLSEITKFKIWSLTIYLCPHHLLPPLLLTFHSLSPVTSNYCNKTAFCQDFQLRVRWVLLPNLIYRR